MILSQLLTKSSKILPSLCQNLRVNNLRFVNFGRPLTYNNFCTNNNKVQGQEQPYTRLISQETFKKFQQLINQSSESSLEEAAQMFGELQFYVEKNQQKINILRQTLQACPALTKGLIQKIHIVANNIKKQDEQIQAIQKRAQKQIADCKNFAVTSIARQMLDIADSLTKCKKMSVQHHKNSDHQAIKSIQNAHKEMRSIFEIYGIKQFDPIGQDYDPNKQEALTTTPSPNQKLKNKVAYTMRTGYTIKGRLLRSAHVGIYS